MVPLPVSGPRTTVHGMSHTIGFIDVDTVATVAEQVSWWTRDAPAPDPWAVPSTPPLGIASATADARSDRRMHARWRTLLASATVVAAGCYATYALTDGLQAFSLETARRLSALRSPAPLPSPTLEYADAAMQRVAEEVPVTPADVARFMIGHLELARGAVGEPEQRQEPKAPVN